MVKAIRYVKDAFINDGDGVMDFVGTVDKIKPDIFVVNEDGASEEKRRFCEADSTSLMRLLIRFLHTVQAGLRLTTLPSSWQQTLQTKSLLQTVFLSILKKPAKWALQ